MKQENYETSKAVEKISERARAFVAPFLDGEITSSGEPILTHADNVAQILAQIGAGDDLQAAAYLSYVSNQLNRPHEVIEKAFGHDMAQLATEITALEKVQQRSRANRQTLPQGSESASQQTEFVRKMLLAFSRDSRVIMLRLVSRLQTLRWCAANRVICAPSIIKESAEVFAPLANRLGIWQIKWEMEDLIFRAQEPDVYKTIAGQLDEKRASREETMNQKSAEIQEALAKKGIKAKVSGRPKHIFSIVKKMRGKKLTFDQVLDVRAIRIIVEDIASCYTVLDWINQKFAPIPKEFDDYIARPKPNGYQSLHTVVRDEKKRPWEIQIRTEEMHEHAESGVAAHWAYKEAGTKGYAGVSAASDYDAKIAMLRQLLAWERDVSQASQNPNPSTKENAPQATAKHNLFDDHIYVLTPDAKIIELAAGATPVDFAYTLHTELGHRCRGAKVNGAMLPLNTQLANGQTVEIIAAKEGGPSRDWLNAELGFLASSRARAKVRAWFNAQHMRQTIAKGREMVEKVLQREGKTATSLDTLAQELGFKSQDALFETVGKDALSLKSIETALRQSDTPANNEENEDTEKTIKGLFKKVADTGKSEGGVLVVGLDSLLTKPARCCKPAPPDEIAGYVTRGKGVSVHRNDCSALRELQAKEPERVIEVAWSRPATGHIPAYPVDVRVEAIDRQGLLRDISDIFARQKINVIGVQTQSIKGWAKMTFTAQVDDTRRLQQVLSMVQSINGIKSARRL